GGALPGEAAADAGGAADDRLTDRGRGDDDPVEDHGEPVARLGQAGDPAGDPGERGRARVGELGRHVPLAGGRIDGGGGVAHVGAAHGGAVEDVAGGAVLAARDDPGAGIVGDALAAGAG